MCYVTNVGLERAFYKQLKTDKVTYGWHYAEIMFKNHQNHIKCVLKNFNVLNSI